MGLAMQRVVDVLADGLRANASVYAMWLEGSAAHGCKDEYSDIDVWLDVEDGHAGAVMALVRNLLSAIGPLDYAYEPERHPHPQIRQAYFHIEGTPPFLIVDLCIQDHSRESAFIAGFADQKVRVLFDKTGVISYRAIDWEAFHQGLARRRDEITRALPLARIRVKKEARRGNFLEALNYYHEEILKPLVDLIRMRHEPTKHDFGLKHIHRDLPEEVIARLEPLYAVSSLADIEAKCEDAAEWFAGMECDGSTSL